MEGKAAQLFPWTRAVRRGGLCRGFVSAEVRVFLPRSSGRPCQTDTPS